MSGDLVIGDWGNTQLRLWRIADGAVAERCDGPGMAGLTDPAGALRSAIAAWSPARVVLCGMAGARNGLHEVPYVDLNEVPSVEPACDVARWQAHAVEIEFDGTPVTIAAGLSRPDDHGPGDVMRGEETQVFGLLAREPAMATGYHLMLLPGTHSKWVGIARGHITIFQTHMTGELFGLLGNSTLFSVNPGGADDEEAGFAAGLSRSADDCAPTATLFEARAAQLRQGKSSGWDRGFVSGLLIGWETRWHAGPRIGRVTIIGEPGLSTLYAKALAHWGVDSACRDGEECAIAGLRLLDAHD